MLTVPEVLSVVGKFGRADSALDPAPIGMMESIVILKPEDQWRTIKLERFLFSSSCSLSPPSTSARSKPRSAR